MKLHSPKNVTKVEITLYSAEGNRSIQTSMQNIMQNFYEPKAQAKNMEDIVPTLQKERLINRL